MVVKQHQEKLTFTCTQRPYPSKLHSFKDLHGQHFIEQEPREIGAFIKIQAQVPDVFNGTHSFKR